MIDIAKELKNLVELPIDPSLFPIEKENKILIGNCFIVKTNNGWAVYKDKKYQVTTATKTAGIAAAHRLKHRQPQLLEICRLDKIISKNITDCVYYKNLLQKAKKSDVKECASIRLEDSTLHIKEARDKLESFIYPKAKYKQ
jgi:hypothetical protein